MTPAGPGIESENRFLFAFPATMPARTASGFATWLPMEVGAHLGPNQE